MHEPRPCPIAGCSSTRAAGHVMCRTHWRAVPKALQREVYAAWRAGTVGEHLQAVENARAAVEHREPTELDA